MSLRDLQRAQHPELWGLPVRVANALLRATAHPDQDLSPQLCGASDAQLLGLLGIGPRALAQIRAHFPQAVAVYVDESS